MSDPSAKDHQCCSQFMRPVLDNIRHNPGADIIRYGRRVANVLALGTGETDTPTPGFITRAVKDALDAGHTFYGPILGRTDLRQAIAEYYKNIYDVALPLDRVIVTASGTSAIHLALTSILEKGDEVVAILPMWKNLIGAIRLAQAEMRGVDLRLENDAWHLDIEAIFAAVTPKTRAIVINSPNNPTGWVMSENEMRRIMDFARQRGLWVVSDEVYGRMVFDQKRAPSFLDVALPDDKLFVVNSFSKNWAMTGWRLGWLVAPAVAEQRIYDLVLYDNMGPANFLQFGGIAALKEGESFLDEQKTRFLSNRNIVCEALAGIPRIKNAPPQSSFYAFFKVEGEPDCMAFAKRLIDNHALGLAPGCSFGDNYNGYIRLCYAVSEPLLRDALGRLSAALK